MERKIIRVFPRRTRATPTDENVRIGCMPGFFDEADEVHISVAFTWDKAWAEDAAKQWGCVAPVKVGGPAFNTPGGEFVPGLYLKMGYVITSRGCHNRCWFCNVPKREGGIVRELAICEGWNVTDDNLLACSEGHIREVFEMLRHQKVRPCFTGGLEAKLLTYERAKELYGLKPQRMYFAYDTPDDLMPLVEAGTMLYDAGFRHSDRVLGCYVLVGYKGDTKEKAFDRMKEAYDAGFIPMAMLYRNHEGESSPEWRSFQRQWANPVIRACNCKKYFEGKKE